MLQDKGVSWVYLTGFPTAILNLFIVNISSDDIWDFYQKTGCGI